MSSGAFATLAPDDRLRALTTPTRVSSRFEVDSMLGLRGDTNTAPGEPGARRVRAPLAALDVCDCLMQLPSDQERSTLIMALPVEASAATLTELRLRGCFGDFLSLGSRYGAQAVRAAVEGKAASRRKAKKIDGAAVAAAQGVALLDCTSPQALAKLLTSLPTAEAALLLTEVARRSSGDGEGPVGAVLSLLPSGSTASMLAAATPAARARMLGAFSSLPQRQAAFRRLSLEAQADAVAAMPSPNQRSAAMAMAEDRAELEVAVEKTLKKVEGGNRMKNSRPTGSAGTEGDRDQAELTKLMGKGKALTPAETQRVQTLMQKQGKKSAGKSKSDGALDAPVVVPQHPPAAPPVAKAENPAMEASTTVAPHDEASVHALASLLASCGLTHFLKAFVGAGHGSITAVASLSEAELIAAGLKRGHILKLRRAVTADPDEGEPTQAASHAAAGVPEFKEEEAWDTPAEAAPAMFLGCIPCVWFS